jgi:hypothetical protein
VRDHDRRADGDGAEDREEEEEDLQGGADPGNRRRAEPGHQDRVHHPDERFEQILRDHRPGQADDAAIHRARRCARAVGDGR